MKPTTEDEEKVIELEPSMEDVINRKINHRNFAKMLYWLCIQTNKTNIIVPKDVMKFLKVTRTRAYQILEDFENIGLIKKRGTNSVYVEYTFITNGNSPLILKYFDKAKKAMEGMI